MTSAGQGAAEDRPKGKPLPLIGVETVKPVELVKTMDLTGRRTGGGLPDPGVPGSGRRSDQEETGSAPDRQEQNRGSTAYQAAMAAMARVARQLPKDIDPPLIFKADPSQLPVVQLTVRSERWDLVELRTWADNWLQDQLPAVPGVAGTEVLLRIFGIQFPHLFYKVSLIGRYAEINGAAADDSRGGNAR